MEIIQVPNTKGELRLVGRGQRGIYRFDDPIGPAVLLARSEAPIDHIGAGPGLVAVWDYQSYAPRFIDVDTGQIKTLAGMPALPARAMAFRNEREGAAAFEAAGLAVTTNGGSSWRLIDDGADKNALRVTGIRLDQGSIEAFVYTNGPRGAVDVAQRRLSPMRERPEPVTEAPLLKWIRVTERDPLEAAASSGVEAQGGAALIASHGLIARVDTKTGAIGELHEFAKGYGLSTCAMARSGASAWAACTLSEGDDNSDFSDPFGVFRVELSGAHITADRPALRRSGEAEVRASLSGGLLVAAPCSPDDEGDVCVRQPDGTWHTLSVKADVWRSGAGPLADGRVAFVRGLEEGDEGSSDGDGAFAARAEGEGAGDEGRTAGRPSIVAIDKSGKERRVATLNMDRGERELRVMSPIEEDADHTLRFVLADEEGVFAVAQHPDHEGASPQRISQATHARLHAGRGIAIGEGRVLSSADGGSTWIEAPTPARVREALADVTGSIIDEPGAFVVSEIGAKLDTQLRIGFGQADALSEARPAEAKVTLGERQERDTSPEKERLLSCKSAGAATSIAPLAAASELTAFFTKGKPPQKPQKGKNVRTSQALTGRAGMIDTLAVLEEQSTDKLGDPPKSWSIRWVDSSEIGAKVRTWSGAPPKGAAWGTTLRTAYAWGGRALFSLRSGKQQYLIRVKSSGASDVVAVDSALIPTAEVEFGAEKSDVIAWVHDTSIVVWLPGEAPRTIATIGGRSTRALGQPTKDGVPVLLSFNDVALMSTLPIPPTAKAAAGSKEPSPPAPPPPVAITLDGWTPVVNLVRKDVTRLAPCAAKPKGARFVFTARSLNVKVDGVDHAVQDAVYDAAVAPGEACVAQVAALVGTSRRAVQQSTSGAVRGKPAKPAAPAPTPASSGPVAWLRADMIGKRAEGGDRGVQGSARKLTCSLEAKP